MVRPVVGGRGEGGEVGEVWMEVVFSPSDLGFFFFFFCFCFCFLLYFRLMHCISPTPT